MNDTIVKLLSTVALDELLFTLYAIALFWVLLVTARSQRFSDVFKDTGESCLSLRRLLSAYIVVAYTTYIGYISINKMEAPDIPIGVIGLVLVLLGLMTAEKIAERFGK